MSHSRGEATTTDVALAERGDYYRGQSNRGANVALAERGDYY